MAEFKAGNKDKAPVGLTLDADEVTGRVTATLSVDTPDKPITQALVQEQLESHHASNWKINQSAIDDLINKAKKKIETRIVIAERKNASARLTLSDDHMTATLLVTPASGGEPLNSDDILQQLTKNRVDLKRMDKKGINEAIHCTEEKPIVIARGKPPVMGQDSQFVPLVHDDGENTELQEDEQGRVDFYAGKTYSTVEAGTPILQRLPPEPGQVGMDIFGQIIASKPGNEIPFAKKMDGTEFASNDPNLVIAKISGHPVFFDHGVRVDNSLSLDSVGLNTGHVNFDGSVEVKGDVMADMRIEATGDVFIKGTVERAKIIAGQNIVIGGGVVGDTSVHIEEGDELPLLECRLEATGNISVRYCNLSGLKAEGNIEVREYAFHSSLSAGNAIALGQNGGKGNLVGGDTVAGKSVTAKMLGNRAYNTTRLRVGLLQEDWILVQKLRFLREQRLEQARNLRQSLSRLKEKGTTQKLGQLDINKAKKIHDTLLKLQQAVREIDSRMNQLTMPPSEKDEPFVSATAACFPNCEITINGIRYVIKQEHRAITFVKRGNVITAKS